MHEAHVAVLLFALDPAAEARAKRLRGAAQLFAATRRRLEMVCQAAAVDLLIAGDSRGRGVGRVFVQRGESFGERLENALADALELGYDAVVVVPGDVPHFGAAVLVTALTELRAGRAVLGPSPDGGVHLLGLPAGAAPLLSRVPWQTDAVAATLQELLPDALVLPSLRDLDGVTDVSQVATLATLPRFVWALLRSIVGQLQASFVAPESLTGIVLVAKATARGPPLYVSP